MKAIIINEGNDPIQKMVMFPEDAAGDPGRRCAVGFRFVPRRSIAQAPDGKCLTDENGHDIWELDPSLCKLEIHPRLFGRCATWEEIIIALYWGEDGHNFGEQLEGWAREAHRARCYPWRVQKERFSGYTEYRIRESEDETGREFGLAGRIAACLRITPNDKVNEGMSLSLPLADWYVFLYSIPHRPLAELEGLYKNTPPQELYPIKTEWNAPGVEPWESK